MQSLRRRGWETPTLYLLGPRPVEVEGGWGTVTLLDLKDLLLPFPTHPSHDVRPTSDPVY